MYLDKLKTVAKKKAIKRTKIAGPKGVSTAVRSAPIMLVGEKEMKMYTKIDEINEQHS